MFGYPRTFEKRGADLALISFVGTPSMVDLASADSWGELDLWVRPGGQGGLPQSRDAEPDRRHQHRTHDRALEANGGPRRAEA